MQDYISRKPKILITPEPVKCVLQNEIRFQNQIKKIIPSLKKLI